MANESSQVELTPTEVAEHLANGRARLFDIRPEHERLACGYPAGGTHETDPVRLAEHARRQPVILVCASGRRSLRLTEQLRAQGCQQAFSMAGGLDAWRAEGLKIEYPPSPLSAVERLRYLRHLALPGVGESGQLRLRGAGVLVVGAGGLGSPAAFYLAAAGVGRIGLVDDDRVDRSNLQRQILHTDAMCGAAKLESAHQRLSALNPDIAIELHRLRLDRDNAEAILSGYDLIVDGSDNFPTRYLINDLCIRLARPMVYGAVQHFAGQVAVFAAGDGVSPCYRCLFPHPPAADDAPNCAEAGVLGVVPGVIGCLQASEAIKWLLGAGQPLTGRLLRFDALAGRFQESRFHRDPDCRWCDPRHRPDRLPDYEAFCATDNNTPG